jgi:hypothetical protein
MSRSPFTSGRMLARVGRQTSLQHRVRSRSERQLDMRDAVEPEISKEDKWRFSRRQESGKLSRSRSNEPRRQPTRYFGATSRRSLLRFESGRDRSSGWAQLLEPQQSILANHLSCWLHAARAPARSRKRASDVWLRTDRCR